MLKENLRFLRKHNGYTQKELAKLFGVTQSYISDIEYGDKDPKLEILEKYVQAFNVTYDDLINRDLSVQFVESPEITFDDAMNLGNNLYPFLTSDLAESNDNFNHAYKKLDSSLGTGSLALFYSRTNVLEYAITLFQKAWEESNTYVALANSISIILYMYSMYSFQTMNIGHLVEELVIKESIDSINVPSDYKNSISGVKYTDKQKVLFEKYNRIVYDSIKSLRTNSQFSELGDYYLALCCIVGFIRDEEYEYCVNAGRIMIDQLCELNNKYAIALKKVLPKIS